ncbi:hypothetical protein ACVLD2_003380 [Paenibacillus sp. PvR052]|nr:hypothetical protein [Paenibacillus sp. PvP091]MBP1170837.1 hypothetical protein [Paenibacillus sp. PvR098]MBP2441865.1 hypothetical protein [Paenibacillus sp. PvP052]
MAKAFSFLQQDESSCPFLDMGIRNIYYYLA